MAEQQPKDTRLHLILIGERLTGGGVQIHFTNVDWADHGTPTGNVVHTALSNNLRVAQIDGNYAPPEQAEILIRNVTSNSGVDRRKEKMLHAAQRAERRARNKRK